MTRSTQGFLRRILGIETEWQAHQAPASQHLSTSPVIPTKVAQFGEFGEKGEKVGQQIAYFVSRLEELYSLRHEFAAVAKPMQTSSSLTQSQTRLAETTALLTRERTDAQNARAETLALRAAHANIENELAYASNQIKMHEEATEGRAAQLHGLKLSLDDTASRLDWANRQLAAESQANVDHANAKRIIGEDVNRLEQELALEKTHATELKDQNEVANAEIRRLQDLVERLQPSLVTAKRRIGDLENEIGAHKVSVCGLELKIAREQEVRSATEAARAQEKIDFENEISALALQVEALESRHATTTKMFDQSRALLNEKIDYIRQSERSAKDMQTEKIAAERRHLSAQDEIRNFADQVTALGARNQEVQERCSMLSNAMAAKDAQIEQLEGRCDSLKHRLEDTTTRYEQERMTVEGLNRKLIEEVQTERAERALAQGALSIARNSREKLLGQIEELKRGRLVRPTDADETEPYVSPNAGEGPNNIHKFRTPELSGDGA